MKVRYSLFQGPLMLVGLGSLLFLYSCSASHRAYYESMAVCQRILFADSLYRCLALGDSCHIEGEVMLAVHNIRSGEDVEFLEYMFRDLEKQTGVVIEWQINGLGTPRNPPAQYIGPDWGNEFESMLNAAGCINQ